MTDPRKLKVWQKAHILMIDAHRLAGRIRGTQYASLRNQIIRASMSISTNIVEGCGQQSPRDYARFLRFSLNSATELEYHFIVARDINALSASDVTSIISQAIEVRKMLYGLLRYLETRTNKQQ